MNIVIYGRTSPRCIFCDAAKIFCIDNKLDFEFRDISITPGFKNELLVKVPDAKTIPQIFIDDEHIGGFEDFEHYMEKVKHD